MAIRIITDSGSDIRQKTARRWGVRVLPLTVRFGEEEYRDDVELTADAMYARMEEKGEIPQTSQVPPFDFEEAFREAMEAGDEVVCITCSSGLSGCYQSAMIAAGEFDGRVSVVDSLNVCASQYVLVRYAQGLVRMGRDREEIVRRLENNKKRLHVIALTETLEYAAKGGRVSRAVAMAGGLLNIKPIITAGREGKVELIGKARGTARAWSLFSKLIEKTGGIDRRLPVCMAYAGRSDENMRAFMKEEASLFEGLEDRLHTTQIGATVGTYSGPGAIAIGFFHAI